MKIRHIISYFLVLLIISGITYYWGYRCGVQELNQSKYDQSLINLTNSIMFYNAIKINDYEKITPMVISYIESNFADMATIYHEYEFKNTEHLRCAVSRRFRVLRESDEVLSSKNNLEDYPIEVVNEYIEKECPGEPSHNNWILNQ